MKVIITGATSFIGLHLMQYLLDEGHEVIAVCRKNSRNLASLVNKNVEIVFSDMQEYSTLGNKIINADAFIKSNPQKGIIYTMAQNFKAHYVGFNKVGETADGEALYLFHNAGRRTPYEWASKNGKRYLCPKPQTLSDYLARERDRCIILYNVQ